MKARSLEEIDADIEGLITEALRARGRFEPHADPETALRWEALRRERNQAKRNGDPMSKQAKHTYTIRILHPAGHRHAPHTEYLFHGYTEDQAKRMASKMLKNQGSNASGVSVLREEPNGSDCFIAYKHQGGSTWGDP